MCQEFYLNIHVCSIWMICIWTTLTQFIIIILSAGRISRLPLKVAVVMVVLPICITCSSCLQTSGALAFNKMAALAHTAPWAPWEDHLELPRLT